MLPLFSHSKPCWLLLFLIFVDLLYGFRITGATGGVDSTTGSRPLRYEIGQFSSSGAPFDLFILSLIAFQKANQSDPLSYFQISGTEALRVVERS